MELILSPFCESLTGTLSKRHGVFIKQKPISNCLKRCISLTIAATILQNREFLTLPEATFLVASFFCSTFASVFENYPPFWDHFGTFLTKVNIMKKFIFISVILAAVAMASCNVTRTMQSIRAAKRSFDVV